jgi:hypothetical protein
MRRVLLAVLSLALLNSTVLAAPNHSESGDAGGTIGTAQLVDLDGNGPVTSITGGLNNTNDVDFYRIFIDNPAGFSASTSSGSDPQLFLFRLNGDGLQGNDDASGLEAILGPNIPGLTTPGYYALAISLFDHDPYDALNNLIFETVPFGPQYGPFPNVGPVDHFAGKGDFPLEEQIPYTINLTGVTHTPEPATMIAWATVGGIGFAVSAIRRRRKAKAAE